MTMMTATEDLLLLHDLERFHAGDLEALLVTTERDGEERVAAVRLDEARSAVWFSAYCGTLASWGVVITDRDTGTVRRADGATHEEVVRAIDDNWVAFQRLVLSLLDMGLVMHATAFTSFYVSETVIARAAGRTITVEITSGVAIAAPDDLRDLIRLCSPTMAKTRATVPASPAACLPSPLPVTTSTCCAECGAVAACLPERGCDVCVCPSRVMGGTCKWYTRKHYQRK